MFARLKHAHMRTRTAAAAVSAIVLAMVATLPASAAGSSPAGVGDPGRERADAGPDEVREIRAPGFRLVDGRYTSIQVPGSRTHTYLHGINDRGLIAGGFDNPSFDGPNGMGHGIVRLRDGRFVRFDVRGAVSTIANKINDRGQVAGGFNRTGTSVGSLGTMGFLRGPRGVRVINVPGSIETQALGINNAGVVVGEYVDADGIFHGFRWKRGRFTTIDGPGSLGGAVLDVNDRGHMVGVYLTKDGGARGFLLRKGSYQTFSAPYGPIDLPFDINNRGQIVGTSLSDRVGTRSHGFLLRRGIGGPYTRIGFPGTTQTVARGIDDHGRIVGLYGKPDASSAQRGPAVGAPLLDSLPLGLAATGLTR